MKAFLQSGFVLLLFVLISCNPDEDSNNNGNSGNNGNNGNNGGGGSAMSYSDVVNLLSGNWYGQSVILYNSDGTEAFSFDETGTMSLGYLTLGSTSIGSVDFTPIETNILPPPFENLVVSKYPASVTITNGSWSGSGAEELTAGAAIYASEGNLFTDKSYTVVKYTTPFLNITTPTIQYGLMNLSEFNTYFSDVSIGMGFNESDGNRIHTLNGNTLKLIGSWNGDGYGIVTYTKQ